MSEKHPGIIVEDTHALVAQMAQEARQREMMAKFVDVSDEQSLADYATYQEQLAKNEAADASGRDRMLTQSFNTETSTELTEQDDKKIAEQLASFRSLNIKEVAKKLDDEQYTKTVVDGKTVKIKNENQDKTKIAFLHTVIAEKKAAAVEQQAAIKLEAVKKAAVEKARSAVDAARTTPDVAEANRKASEAAAAEIAANKAQAAQEAQQTKAAAVKEAAAVTAAAKQEAQATRDAAAKDAVATRIAAEQDAANTANSLSEEANRLKGIAHQLAANAENAASNATAKEASQAAKAAQDAQKAADKSAVEAEQNTQAAQAPNNVPSAEAEPFQQQPAQDGFRPSPQIVHIPARYNGNILGAFRDGQATVEGSNGSQDWGPQAYASQSQEPAHEANSDNIPTQPDEPQANGEQTPVNPNDEQTSLDGEPTGSAANNEQALSAEALAEENRLKDQDYVTWFLENPKKAAAIWNNLMEILSGEDGPEKMTADLAQFFSRNKTKFGNIGAEEGGLQNEESLLGDLKRWGLRTRAIEYADGSSSTQVTGFNADGTPVVDLMNSLASGSLGQPDKQGKLKSVFSGAKEKKAAGVLATALDKIDTLGLRQNDAYDAVVESEYDDEGWKKPRTITTEEWKATVTGDAADKLLIDANTFTTIKGVDEAQAKKLYDQLSALGYFTDNLALSSRLGREDFEDADGINRSPVRVRPDRLQRLGMRLDRRIGRLDNRVNTGQPNDAEIELTGTVEESEDSAQLRNEILNINNPSVRPPVSSENSGGGTNSPEAEYNANTVILPAPNLRNRTNPDESQNTPTGFPAPGQQGFPAPFGRDYRGVDWRNPADGSAPVIEEVGYRAVRNGTTVPDPNVQPTAEGAARAQQLRDEQAQIDEIRRQTAINAFEGSIRNNDRTTFTPSEIQSAYGLSDAQLLSMVKDFAEFDQDVTPEDMDLFRRMPIELSQDSAKRNAELEELRQAIEHAKKTAA